MIRVRVFKDGQAQPHVDVRKDEFVIGRGAEADVQLAAEAVSRRHARLTRTPEGWQIADLGAANGVYVSTGEGAPERIVIRQIAPGDQIHIESYVLLFEEVEDSESAVPEVEEDFGETSLETKRTQFISMVDVLAAKEAAEREAEAVTKPPAASRSAAPAQASRPASAPAGVAVVSLPSTPPATSAAPAASSTWWVHLSSSSGHERSFTLGAAQVSVGSAKTCEVRLPEGPGVIVELERVGDSVGLRRVSRWPFPRVQVDGRSVRETLLSDGDTFVIGDFEVRVHLREAPRVSGYSDGRSG